MYEVPDSPADPEAAALELIVRMPGEVLHTPAHMRDVLQEFCGMLQLEGCFAGAKFENGKLVEAPRRRNDREGSRLTTMRQRTASSSDAYVFIGARPHRAVSGA
jgi:hypothetical protein